MSIKQQKCYTTNNETNREGLNSKVYSYKLSYQKCKQCSIQRTTRGIGI